MRPTSAQPYPHWHMVRGEDAVENAGDAPMMISGNMHPSQIPSSVSLDTTSLALGAVAGVAVSYFIWGR